MSGGEEIFIGRQPILDRNQQLFADFYRGHMMIEEDIVLPLVREHLTAEDWAEVDQLFLAEMDEKSGKDGSVENFSVLFSRLVDCAPAPIGLGPRPYVE